MMSCKLNENHWTRISEDLDQSVKHTLLYSVHGVSKMLFILSIIFLWFTGLCFSSRPIWSSMNQKFVLAFHLIIIIKSQVLFNSRYIPNHHVYIPQMPLLIIDKNTWQLHMLVCIPQNTNSSISIWYSMSCTILNISMQKYKELNSVCAKEQRVLKRQIYKAIATI